MLEFPIVDICVVAGCLAAIYLAGFVWYVWMLHKMVIWQRRAKWEIEEYIKGVTRQRAMLIEVLNQVKTDLEDCEIGEALQKVEGLYDSCVAAEGGPQ